MSFCASSEKLETERKATKGIRRAKKKQFLSEEEFTLCRSQKSLTLYFYREVKHSSLTEFRPPTQMIVTHKRRYHHHHH